MEQPCLNRVQGSDVKHHAFHHYVFGVEILIWFFIPVIMLNGMSETNCMHFKLFLSMIFINLYCQSQLMMRAATH